VILFVRSKVSTWSIDSQIICFEVSWKCYVKKEMDLGLHPKTFLSLEYYNLLV